jgi:hypothetical protein
MFGGKESAKEELAEAKALKSGKISKSQYVAGEKSEGESKGVAKKANAIKSGKLSPSAYAKGEKPFKCGGKVKKYAEGGEVEGGDSGYTYDESVDPMVAAKARMAEKDAEYAAKYGSQSESTPAPKAKPKAKADTGVRDYGTFKTSRLSAAENADFDKSVARKKAQDKAAGVTDYGTFKTSKLSPSENADFDKSAAKKAYASAVENSAPVKAVSDRFKGAGSVSRKDLGDDVSVPRSKRFAEGGMVRGTGAATKGKKFSGVY